MSLDLNEWKYSFENWIPVFEAKPIDLIKYADYGDTYEMDQAEVFALENGKFALVIECGCSCYEPADAQIEIFPSQEKAFEAFNKWERIKKQNKAERERFEKEWSDK